MYTIVVADDEEGITQSNHKEDRLGRASDFKSWGSGGNGIEALELMERMEPDLLLTDIGCLLSPESSWQDRSERYVLPHRSPS